MVQSRYFSYLLFLSTTVIANLEIFCTQNTTISYGTTFYYYPEQVNLEKEKAFHNTTTIKLIDDFVNFSLFVEDNIMIVYNGASKEHIIQVYHSSNIYKLFIFEIILEISEEQILSKSLKIINEIKLEISLCKKINDVYVFYDQIFINCDQEDYHLFYRFLKPNLNSFGLQQQPISVQKFIKSDIDVKLQKAIYFSNNSCQINIKINSQSQEIFLSLLNCFQWSLYRINEYNLELIVDHSQINFQKLRDFSTHTTLYLIFETEIYEINQFKKQSTNKIYSNPKFQINQFYNEFINQQIKIIFFDNFSNSSNTTVQFEDSLIFIQDKNSPIDLYILKNSIFVLFNDYILLIYSVNEWFILNIKAEELLLNNAYYPYFFGMQENQILTFKLISNPPFLKCNDFKNGQNLILKIHKFSFSGNEKHLINRIKFLNLDMQYFDYFLLNKINKIDQIAIKNESQIFQIVIKFDSVLPKIMIQNTEELKCEIEEVQVLEDCQQNITDIFWEKYIYYQNQFFLVFQTKNKSLNLKNCLNGFVKYVATLDFIQNKHYYNFQNQFLFVHSQQHKLLSIFMDQFFEIELSYFEFSQKIVNIVQFKRSLKVVLIDCTVAFIDVSLKNQKFNSLKYYSNKIQLH